MSFWKFGFAQSSINAIDTILNTLPSTSTGTFANHSLSAEDRVKIESALDSLLDNPDLLNELKSGSNQRLIDFISRAEVVNRLAGWVLWGLGGAQLGSAGSSAEGAADSDQEPFAATPTGIVSDDVQDGKVPEALIQVAHTSQIGYGGVPVRSAVAAKKQSTPADDVSSSNDDRDDDEMSEAEKMLKRPRLATEILCGDVPSLDNILFEPDAATTQPSFCPRSPESFIVPFWDTLLRSTEQQLESYAVQVGYWTRINMTLLSGPRHAEALKVVMSIPHLLQRLLALIPACSPLSDLLLLILRTASSESQFVQNAVPAIVRLLDPFAPSGNFSHLAADELLRGIIDQCSAVPMQPQPGFGGMSGGQDGPGAIEWRDNFLARQIADERTVRTLVHWMFDAAGPIESPPNEVVHDARDDQVTPRLPSKSLPALSTIQKSSSGLRTSALVHSIAVLVDLIRKNNSDFVEQQMLNWARRKQDARDEQAEDAQDTMTGLDGRSADLGPSLVDLSAVLKVLTERLPDFQALLNKPRSSTAQISTSSGSVQPLTLERYRICELYAEMLHSSNMGLTNRTKTEFVDEHGRLKPDWQDPDKLGELLSQALRLTPASHDSADSSFNDSPHVRPNNSLDLPRLSSGFSSPSVAGSLDSESGVLTRAEAKELHDLIAASAGEHGADEDGDPFGDQFESSSDSELAGAVESIQLDEDLGAATSPEFTRSPAVFASSPNGRIGTPVLKTYLPPGPSLKSAFMHHGVIRTMLDLFFNHPLNNFLHNVVFDIMQQIFHGRLDRPLDRQLAISVFTDGLLVDRILEAQKASDTRPAKTPRPGYMGHMTLIAEEVVKLFQRQPTAIYNIVEKRLPQPAWYEYVTTTLKDIRERESVQLGGAPAHVDRDLPSAPSVLEDDDEFPMNSSRSMRAQEKDRSAGPVSGQADPLNGAGGIESADDKFSRYLVQTMVGDRGDEFSSSDEDDEDDGANQVLSHFGAAHFSEGDYDLNVSAEQIDAATSAPTKIESRGPQKLGFDDRFDEADPSAFRKDFDSDDEAEWGPYSSDALNKSEFPATLDHQAPRAPNQTPASDSSGFDDDDFGDFAGADGVPLESPEIVLPSFDDHADFDFSTHHITANDRLGVAGAASGESGSDTSRNSTPPGQEVEQAATSSSMPRSPSFDADKATSIEEPLGPAIHPGARLDDFGRVEAVVEGQTVIVPADDIALAHHRRSSMGSGDKTSEAIFGSPVRSPELSASPSGLQRRRSSEARRRRSVDGQPPELATL